MAKQTVGIGTVANDGTGDTARVAFDKINDNFNEVYTNFGDGSTLSAYLTSTILASNTNAEGASLIGIEDSAALITATDVEGALAEFAGVFDTHGDIVTSDTTDFVGINNQGYRVFNSGGVNTTARPTNVPTDQTVAWRNYGTSGLPTNALSYDIFLDEPGITFMVAASDETTALTTGTAKLTFRMPYAMTVTKVKATVNTAPTGSGITVDVNEGGTSIFSTLLTIDATEKTSETAATAAVISDSALADDAEITIDIDAVGSTVAGAGLKITFIGDRA